jgi:DNA-binding response OmpR family regulator
MTSGPSSKPRILVVEDEPDLRGMLQRILSTIAEVAVANDGLDALERIRAGFTPDLIVSDVMMPRMDGLTLAKELKKDAALARIPLVMLTAKTAAKDVIAGINAGARAYVTKPFKTDELLSKVKKALGQKK